MNLSKNLSMTAKNTKSLLIITITLVLLNSIITKNPDLTVFSIADQKSDLKSFDDLEKDNKIYLSENSLNENEKLFRLLDDNRYDIPITFKWNRDLALAYRDIAGIGYISRESATMQIQQILKGDKKDKNKVGFFFRKFFEIGDWEHVNTFTGGPEINFFSYTILRNKRIGKVILTFSGTKGVKQLFTQLMNSGLETFYKYDESQKDNSSNTLTKENIIKNLENFNKNKDINDYDQKTENEKAKQSEKNSTLKNFKIMKYFNLVYKTISKQLLNDVKKAISNEINQYIFVGHSLGGAMASIAAYDLISEGIIQKKIGKFPSPVLITYGQPRTGNYVFANEVSKKIPIIYRHVNNYDLITSKPDCYKINSYCVNEYNKSRLDLEFSDYDSIEIDEKVYNSNSFPWHTKGLILNIDDDNSNECIENSEADLESQSIIVTSDKGKDVDKNCLVESKMIIAFHTIYYGYKVGDMFKPEIFKYHLTEISCSLEDLFDFDFKIPFYTSIQGLNDYLFKKAPLPIEAEDAIDDNLVFLEDESKKEEIKTQQKIVLFSNKAGICYYLLKIFRFFGKYQ